MGVTLDLRLIDHERIAVRGLRVVNAALRENNPEILREYLATLPIDVDQEIVEQQKERLSKLREFDAPEVIIENEERRLHLANGEAYKRERYQNASFEELRNLLGTWCWMAHTYSLDKAHKELHWFLEPKAGSIESPLLPDYPQVGNPKQSVFDRALQGTVSYPVDDRGTPIIHTLGSQEWIVLGTTLRRMPRRFSMH
jgi:hypothetical protein